MKVKVFDVDENGDKLPEFHYMAISSKDSPYYLHTNPHLSCDCPDFEIRGEVCKHLLRALIVEGDPQVMKAVRKFNLEGYYDS